MTDTHVQRLAARFQVANEELISLVTACGDARWRSACASEGWSVAVVAHHVAEVNHAFARMVATLASGQTFSPRSSMDQVHASNAQHAREYASVGVAETLVELRESGEVVLRELRGLSDERLEAVAGLFGGRDMTVAQVVDYVVIGHTAEHLASVRDTLATPAA